MSNPTLMWEPSMESTPMDRFREQVNQKFGLNLSECVHVFLRYSLRCLTNRVVCCMLYMYWRYEVDLYTLCLYPAVLLAVLVMCIH